MLGHVVYIGHAVANFEVEVSNVCLNILASFPEQHHQVLDPLLVLLMHVVLNRKLADVVAVLCHSSARNHKIWLNLVALRLESRI